MADTKIQFNADKSRYEAILDDKVVGFADAKFEPGIVEFPHTEVNDDLEGQGIGSKIVEFALKDVRKDDTSRVRPTCPFVKHFIDEHEEYQELLER